MSDSSPVRVDTQNAVARVWLTRSAVHNAFDDTLIAALTDALCRLAQDERVRVVVLCGEGASFSAGADLNWMRRMAAASAEDNRADALRLAALMRTLDGMPQATVARVHGAAYGGGVGLIACCDIAVAASAAKFGLTETKLGLVPAVISPYVIAAIGARQARRCFLNAEIFDAATALRLGLVHEIVDAEQLDARVSAQIDLLLKAGPVAVREAKRLVRTVAGADPTQRQALDASNAALIARLRVSPEGQEGLGAFLDKRKPNWISLS
jgi:methylglutaconyl-CoA hydratase